MPASPASGTKQEKTMSSRLLTMKFMQRAAASNAAKETSQSAPSSNSNTPTPKRARLSTGPAESPIATPSKDLEAISAALAAEDDKRREAIARQAAEAGESEWVLDFDTENMTSQYTQPPVVLADTSLDADEDIVYGGRQAYGNFKRKNKNKTQTTQNANDEDDSEEDEEDEDADSEDPDSVDAMIKKAKKKASKGQSKQVKLSKLTSISGGRQGMVGGNKSQKKRKHK